VAFFKSTCKEKTKKPENGRTAKKKRRDAGRVEKKED
jgi:hypothetical protein